MKGQQSGPSGPQTRSRAAVSVDMKVHFNGATEAAEHGIFFQEDPQKRGNLPSLTLNLPQEAPPPPSSTVCGAASRFRTFPGKLGKSTRPFGNAGGAHAPLESYNASFCLFPRRTLGCQSPPVANQSYVL